MLSSKAMICARGIVIDSKTNNVSIFNILEQLNSEGFPLIIPEFSVFNFLERTSDDPSEYDLEVVITNNDVELLRGPLKVNFEDKFKNRAVISIGGLAVPNPGILRTSLLYKGQELGSWDIVVEKIRGPEIKVT